MKKPRSEKTLDGTQTKESPSSKLQTESKDHELVGEGFKENRTGHKLGFDPYQKANIEVANKHRNAQKVRKLDAAMDDPNSEKCACCGFPTQAQEFSICSQTSELNELGPGFPLFYVVYKFTILAIFLGFAIAGIPCLVDNILADNADE